MTDFWPKYIKETVETLKAPTWKLLCVKVFGEKSYGYDGELRVTLHSWRGVTYLTGIKLVGGNYVPPIPR